MLASFKWTQKSTMPPTMSMPNAKSKPRAATKGCMAYAVTQVMYSTVHRGIISRGLVTVSC